MTAFPQLSAKAPAAATRSEVELLLCCARTCVDPETAERIRTLLQEEIDWAYLIRIAFQHHVIPLLYSSLKNTCAEAVPQDILSQLRNHFCANAQYNLFLTKELIKLLNLFEANRIPAIPYKGPVLAASVYGNLALRQFGDLDILVHQRDFLRAQELLISQGYHPPLQNNVEWERFFVHDDSKVQVDLHQGTTPWYLPFPLDFVGLWERLEPVSLTGTRVKNLSPEDLLIILCVQVAKDSQWRYEVLAKICDIAELIHVHQELDWEQVWKQSVKLGSKRMLLFGLYLVSDLLGTVLPERVLLRMQADTVAKLASVKVCEELFNSSGSSDQDDRGIFLGRERLRDKIRYFLRIAITPNEKDWALLPLPKFLYFLYYLLRPIRLIGKYGLIVFKILPG